MLDFILKHSADYLATSYLNTLANIPTIAFGPGDQSLSRTHGADERVEIQNLINFAKIYGLMAMNACGVIS